MGKRIIVRAQLVDEEDPRELRMIANDRQDKEWIAVHAGIDFRPVAAVVICGDRKESGRVRV